MTIALTNSGTLLPSIAAGKVTTPGGVSNSASTSTDNTVTVIADATDSDGDGIPDVIEEQACTQHPTLSYCPTGNPAIEVPATGDSDGDGIPDWQEVVNSSNPTNPNDPTSG